MPPKPASKFVPIQMPAGGGRGGRGGRGSGRKSGTEDDVRDTIPLQRRQAEVLARKRKPEQTVVAEPAAKRVASKAGKDKEAPASTAPPLLSGRVAEVGTSSLRPKIYKQLTLPEMVPGLEPFAKPRKQGFLERTRMDLPDVLKKRWTRSPVKNGEKFDPKLNVLDDESLLLDRPLEGGNLGYRILKATQLKYDIPVDEVHTLAATHAHNLALVR